VKPESILRLGLGCDSPCLEVDHGTGLLVGSPHPDLWRNRAREFASSIRLAERMRTTGSLEPAWQGRPPGSGKLAPDLAPPDRTGW
jgi:hypothetical protein